MTRMYVCWMLKILTENIQLVETQLEDDGGEIVELCGPNHKGN